MIRTAGTGALPWLLLAAPLGAQEVADCAAVPPVTALVEPWEETAAVLAGGAVRLAVIEAEQGAVALLVLTLPPAGTGTGADPPDSGPGAPPPRRCRLVTEGGLGFATLDLAGTQTAEDPEAATFTATLPALRFVPESTELEEATLLLTFGVADDSLLAELGPAP